MVWLGYCYGSDAVLLWYGYGIVMVVLSDTMLVLQWYHGSTTVALWQYYSSIMVVLK